MARGFCVFGGDHRLVQPQITRLAALQQHGGGLLCRGSGGSPREVRCSADLHTDQGAQFTGSAFISVLQAHNIRISMDGKGCWRDNVFVERLWRSVEYEEVYLHVYEGDPPPVSWKAKKVANAKSEDGSVREANEKAVQRRVQVGGGALGPGVRQAPVAGTRARNQRQHAASMVTRRA